MTVKTLMALALAIALAACANPAENTITLEPDQLTGQPLSRTSERPPPFARRIAQSGGVGLGGGIAGFFIGKAVTGALNADERARSRIGEVPTPEGVDPGAIIESTIADYLIAEFGARENVRTFYAGSVRETGSVERGPKVAELAQRRGLSGVVIDVVALEYYADSTGRNLGLVDEAFSIVVTAQMNLVDIASGAVIASGSCEGTQGNTTLISSAVEDGARLTTVLAQRAAAACAQQLIARVSR
ncbi:MAG: hypothetical protein GQ535_14415 [Rhodobacteraceae bacterium]|nr:hypothetical protein [Paracoccaceae bacterium]